MRAAVLTGPTEIEVRDVAEPLRGDATLVHIRWVGICGTDLKIFTGEVPVSYPRIQGHELFGEVIDPGAGALPVGARVVVDPNVWCGRCARCLEGRSNLCVEGVLLGRDGDGGLCEVLAAPRSNVHEVPDGIADVAIPLIQVLTTCVHAQRRVRIVPGEAVVIVGLGVTGLLHLQLARLGGARTVLGISRSPERRAIADELGADLTLDALDPNLDDAVRAATGGSGADLVIECAGTVGTLARSVDLARPGGRILAYGTITETAGPFPYYQLYYKELEVVHARAAVAEDYPVAIGDVVAGRVRLEPLITHRFGLHETAEAIHVAGRGDSLKVVVEVGG